MPRRAESRGGAAKERRGRGAEHPAGGSAGGAPWEAWQGSEGAPPRRQGSQGLPGAEQGYEGPTATGRGSEGPEGHGGAGSEPAGGAWLRLPRLLTIDEAATYLRITRGALYARIHRGSFPALVKIGRHYRVDSARLIAWLDQSRVGAAPAESLV